MFVGDKHERSRVGE